jgi:hypothetical protein
MRRLAGIAIALVLAGAQAGCGGGAEKQAVATPTVTASEPSEDVGKFIKRIVEWRSEGRAIDVWWDLHPAHQAQVSRDLFELCEPHNRPGSQRVQLRIIAVDDELATIPGQRSKKMGKAVSYEVAAPLGPEGRAQDTAYAFAVGSGWVWVLPAEEWSYYSLGECPREIEGSR